VIDLEKFAKALIIENTIINVDHVEKEYSSATGEYDNFYKIVEEGETDSRLDKGIEHLKEIVVSINNLTIVAKEGFGGLNFKMDKMLDKQDKMLDKQDRMIEKQDETTREVRGLRTDMKDHMDQRLERIEADLGEVKAALREKGII